VLGSARYPTNGKMRIIIEDHPVAWVERYSLKRITVFVAY
jgi:hypothetical protein